MSDWRQARCGDVEAIAAIAARVHPLYPERAEVFAERIALFAPGCFILRDEGGEATGYALSHPWRIGQAVALDTLIGELPKDADCLYLHDAALLPQARGRGHAAGLVGRLRDVAAAHSLACLALTAIDGASGLWRKLGFGPVSDPALATRLASYGGGALYMTMPVG